MKKIAIYLCLTMQCIFAMAQKNNAIQEAIANYDYETALSLIDQEPPTIALLYQKGKALQSLDCNAPALEVFKQIIEQDSLNSRAYITAGECCKALNKNKEALDFYKKAVSLSPNNKYVRIQYVSQLLNLRQFNEALAQSNRFSAQDSTSVFLHLKGQSLEGMNNSQEALNCYLRIQELYPTDYLAAAKVGKLYIDRQQYDHAIVATECYRSKDSTNTIVNRQNALAYCLNKYYPTAIDRYEALLNQGDSTFHTCYYLGISYYAMGRFNETYNILRLAREYSPKDVNLLYYLGRACAKTSHEEEGVRFLEEAIAYALPPDSAISRLYTGMAECYKAAQMPAEQIETLKTNYEKYDPQNHRLLYNMAFVYHYKLRNSDRAEQLLEAFLKTRPKESKEKPQAMTDEGDILLDDNNYYNSAEAWLKDIKQRRKKEDFFKGKVELPAKKPTK